MSRAMLSARSDRPTECGRMLSWLLSSLLIGLMAPGCHHEAETHYSSVAEPPTVRLVQPQVRDLVRVIGQPSFIESYERSSVFPKMNAYIKKWNVDIGDKVKKGDPLATLFVPELVQAHGTKQATVMLDQERITLASKVVEVSKADVQAAEAHLEETKEELDRFEAAVRRWDSEVKRIDNEVQRGVVSPQDLLEATNRWKANIASRDAAKATVAKADAELLSRRAALSRALVEVRVAEADLKVADSEEKRLKAWVGYLTLPAPFDGVIVARNANTFDFVLPASGDPSADLHSPYLSPSGTAAPIYVVDRTDIVRIFVDIPEQDANYVHIGTKASVLVKGYRDQAIPGSVTRTSWALNVNSRTLRAEIDLPNPGSQLLPGMYAYARVFIDRPGVHALPTATLMHVGEKTFYWEYEDGHARRVEVQTGVTGDFDPLTKTRWIEVTNRQVPKEGGGEDNWVPIDGNEKVISGDLSILADGTPVEVSTSPEATKVASENARVGSRPANAGVVAAPVRVE